MNHKQSQQFDRLAYAKHQIELLDYDISYEDSTRIEFEYNDYIVKFYPYTGWATGKSIVDGRGLRNLINQIKKYVKP